MIKRPEMNSAELCPYCQKPGQLHVEFCLEHDHDTMRYNAWARCEWRDGNITGYQRTPIILTTELDIYDSYHKLAALWIEMMTVLAHKMDKL